MDRCTACDNRIEGYLPYIITHPDRPNDNLCQGCFYEHMDKQEMFRSIGVPNDVPFKEELKKLSNVGKVISPEELKHYAKAYSPLPMSAFNEPEHYHKHNIDTIQFLQEGFPPDVFDGFAIGHIIKYIQRYRYKGGREDLVKAADYAKRLLDWHDKTHS